MKYANNELIEYKYNSTRWKRLRSYKKKLNPLCERCLAKGIYTSTYIVHHKEYITDKNYEDDNVFYNIDNLESLCQECHNKEHHSNEEEFYFDNEGNLVKKAPL